MDSQTHNQSVVVIWTATCILKYHKKILPFLVPRLLASIWFALLFQPVLRMLLAIALMVLSNGFSHKALLVSDAVMSLCRPSRIICSKTHTGPPPQKGTISLATKCRIWCSLSGYDTLTPQIWVQVISVRLDQRLKTYYVARDKDSDCPYKVSVLACQCTSCLQVDRCTFRTLSSTQYVILQKVIVEYIHIQ